MPNAQEREFATFGIGMQLRAGLLIGFLTISLAANVYMYTDIHAIRDEHDRKAEERERELMERVLSQVEPKIDRIQQNVQQAKEKVDTLNEKLTNHAE